MASNAIVPRDIVRFLAGDLMIACNSLAVNAAAAGPTFPTAVPRELFANRSLFDMFGVTPSRTYCSGPPRQRLQWPRACLPLFKLSGVTVKATIAWAVL